MIRGLEHLSDEDMLKVGVALPGKGSRRPSSTFPIPKGGLKAGEGHFTRAYMDRTKRAGFKLKESQLRSDISFLK